MNYYTVLYVERCTPKHKSFRSKQRAEKFIKELGKREKENGEYSDDFLTGLVIGKYHEADSHKFGQNLLRKLRE